MQIKLDSWHDFFADIHPAKYNSKEFIQNGQNISLRDPAAHNNLFAINYTGRLDNRIVDIDIDNEDLYSLAEEYLPPTLSTKNDKGVNHYFYTNDNGFSSNIKLPGIEIRSNGFCILPPSVVNDVKREWAWEQTPVNASTFDLLYYVKKLLARYYIDKHYPDKGERNKYILYMSAWLCHSKFESDDIINILSECIKNNYDDENRISTVIKTINKFKNDDYVSYKPIEDIIDVTEYKDLQKILSYKKPSNLKNGIDDKIETINKIFCYIEDSNALWDLEHNKFQLNTTNLRALRLSELDLFEDKKRIPIYDVWIKHKDKFKCKSIVYLLGKTQVVNGNLNVWKPSSCEPIDSAELTLEDYWKNMMIEPEKPTYMFPILLLLKGFFINDEKRFDEKAYDFFIKWLAYPLQNPGKKLSTAVVLYSAKQGVGKGSLARIMSDIYEDAFVEVLGSDLTEKYNHYLFRKQFVFIDEIRTDSRSNVLDRIKSMITEPTFQWNQKYQPTMIMDNIANLLLATNYDYALPLTDPDRRFFVVDINTKPSEEFFIKFHAWRKDKGSASFYHYLLNNVNLTGFSPDAPAPMTEAKKEMIEQSKSDLEHSLDFMWNNLPAMFPAQYVYIQLKNIETYKYLTMNAVTRAIKKKGCKKKFIHYKESGLNVWIRDLEMSDHSDQEIINYLEKEGVLLYLQRYFSGDRRIDV